MTQDTGGHSNKQTKLDNQLPNAGAQGDNSVAAGSGAIVQAYNHGDGGYGQPSYENIPQIIQNKQNQRKEAENDKSGGQTS